MTGPRARGARLSGATGCDGRRSRQGRRPHLRLVLEAARQPPARQNGLILRANRHTSSSLQVNRRALLWRRSNMPSTSGATNFRASASNGRLSSNAVCRRARRGRSSRGGDSLERASLVTRASGIDGHPSIQGRRRECATAYDSQSRCGPSADHPSPVSSGPYRFLAVTAQRAQIPVYGSTVRFALEMSAGAEGLEPPAYGFGDRRSTN